MILSRINKKITIITILTLSFLFFFVPSFSEAELLTSEDDIHVKMQPELPKANQDVSINIESYITDLERAEILWYKNSKLIKRGNGETSFSFATSNLGTSDTITIQVKSSNAGLITKNIVISPAEVDLVWEADSFTPPLYKGKALNSHQSKIKIIALPNFVTENGNIIDSNNLIYTWKKDWKVQGNSSGYGKNILNIEGPQMFKDSLIILEVETVDGKLKAKGSINIEAYEPKIIFYENNPLLGVVYSQAISNQFNLRNEEIVITAQPFFFSSSDISKGNLEYNWSMNNREISGSEKDNSITLKQGKDTGVTNLRLEIQNVYRIMQFARNSFNINFSGIQNEKLFGSADTNYNNE